MSFEKIKKLSWDHGFDHCAIAPLRIPERDKSAYLSWIADGFAGQMGYMTRDPQKRLDLATTFPDVQSVLTLGVSYYQGPFPSKPGPGYGRVARYAWGRDYHTVIMSRLEILLKEIQSTLGNSGRAFLAIDTKPLLERSLAEQAGLGFIGKNTMMIVPRSPTVNFHIGSWIFLAEILLDIPAETPPLPPPLAGRGTSSSGCGSCTKCITACPTDAFEGPYRLRADKCISYLTIENKGEIPLDMRTKMGDWLFGCDVCQEVCPFNARSFESRWPELKPENGTGAWVSLQEILEMEDDAVFKKRFAETPLSRPKRRGLVRNACVAAGNSGDKNLLPVLQKLSNDPEPLIRDHASWAVTQLLQPVA